MPLKENCENSIVTDVKTFRRIDRLAYAGIGVYSAINLAWLVWALTIARFGIFDTAIMIGIAAPVIGFLALVVFQCSARSRFSALANALSIITIVSWFFFVWYSIAAASAAV